MNTIAIGSDHAGYELKKLLIDFLIKKGVSVLDKGPFNNESVDYPDFTHPVAEAIEKDAAVNGIIICGSGNGAAITANKHKEIRCALVWNKELAELARQHNNANIISIPARYVTNEEAFSIVESFLNTPFEGGRHQNRIDKINCF